MQTSLLLVLLAATLPSAAAAQETFDVKFQPGNYGTMLSGEVTGQGYVDYKLGAQGGQELFVELTRTGGDGDGTVYFNVLSPGSDNVAIHNSSMDTSNAATVDLPEDGTYTIRVYLMGNDRDTRKTVEYNADVSIQ